MQVYNTLGPDEKSESLLALLGYSLKSFSKLSNQLIISGKAVALKDDLMICANRYKSLIENLISDLEVL